MAILINEGSICCEGGKIIAFTSVSKNNNVRNVIATSY
jgi:hypothetical protein